MSTKTIIAAILLLSAPIKSFAVQQTYAYLSFGTGAAKMHLDDNANISPSNTSSSLDSKVRPFLVEAGGGTYINNNFRVDGSFVGAFSTSSSFKSTSPDAYSVSGKASSYAILLNASFDMNFSPFFSPYLTAGVGISKTFFGLSGSYTPTGGSSTDISSLFSATKGKNLGVAYQFGGGFTTQMSESMKLLVGVKYINIGSHGINLKNKTTTNNGNITVIKNKPSVVGMVGAMVDF